MWLWIALFFRNAFPFIVSIILSACTVTDRHHLPDDWAPVEQGVGSFRQLAGDYAFMGEIGDNSGRKYQLNLFAPSSSWKLIENSTHVKIEVNSGDQLHGLTV